MKLFSILDMVKNAIRNAVIDPLASAPAQPVVGQIYFDTTLNRLQIYNGTTFGLYADNALNLSGQNAAFYLDRANATGTQTAATISNLASTVKAYRLSDFASPAANVPMAGYKLTGLGTPTADGDAATRGWVNSQIQSAAAGIDSKPSVLCLANANIVLNGLQAIDDVTLTAGARVLVRGQTDARENGVWVASAGAWTRAADADENGELNPGAFWYVEQGSTFARSQWRIENSTPITLGTTSITINQFGVGGGYTAGYGISIVGSQVHVLLDANSGLNLDSGGLSVDKAEFAQKFSFTIGDGTSKVFVVNHNLNTKDVVVSLRMAASDEWVMADWTTTDENSITITFGDVVGANSIKGVVVG